MGNLSVTGLIRAKYSTLSQSQKQVADYVLGNPARVMLLSLADLAEVSDVSEPTVMRFLHKLNYGSYQVFRVNIAQESAHTPETAIYSDVHLQDTAADIMNKVLSSTKCALDDLPAVLDPAAIQRLCAALLHADKILIIGVGSTSAIAFDLFHKLLKLGIDSKCLNDPHIINMACNNLTDRSLLVAISHSGESREILDGVDFAHQKRAAVYAITSFQNSSLAKHSEVQLISSSLETNYRSDAMTSRIIQLCIIDMIYIRLALIGGDPMLDTINASRAAVARNKT